MIFIIKSVDSMSPALSKTFNRIFIEIEFYKHIDLQKNRNDIKFLSDDPLRKRKIQIRSQTNGVLLVVIYISALLYLLRLHVKKMDICFSCSRLHAVRQINFEQKLGLHGDDEFIKLS